MLRLSQSDLPDWGDLLARWSVWIDETGRGPYWATSYRHDGRPIKLRADETDQLKEAVERYEQQNGVQPK